MSLNMTNLVNNYTLLTLLSISVFCCNNQKPTTNIDDNIELALLKKNHSYNTKIDLIKNAYINAFNNGAIEEFRAYFNKEMKARNSFKKLSDNFKQMTSQIGLIRSLTLDTTDDVSFSFRSIHEKMVTLSVIFNIDDKGKLNQMKINSGYVYKNAPVLERNISGFILPFNNEWYVFWGGKSTSNNYHNAYPNMKGAFDFWVMGSNGKSHKNGATKNEDFYAFGKNIIAPADAKVIYIIDEIQDNSWPTMNVKAGFGNIILLETKNKEYILFAHLKQNSIKVKNNQLVKQGDILGLCGNSGNSTEPHLHFQIQNMSDLAAAKGAWVHFKKIGVNGNIKEDYLPVRGDKISNF